MIFIIIFSVFTIYIPKVEASTNVCCEQTTSNLGGINACIYTDIGNCVPDKQKEQVACEQTNYCTLGTCVVNGQCSSNVYKQQCISDGGIWKQGAKEEVEECKTGCCNLPTGAKLISRAGCALLAEGDVKLQEVFDASINDEKTCLEKSLGTEEGCCVSTNECTFGSRKSCNEKAGEFNYNKICSWPDLGCSVTPKYTTGCLPNKDEVYWFDSAGNIENIYGAVYNQDGERVKKETMNNVSLSIDKKFDITNGNCDFAKGSKCTTASADFLRAIKSSNIENKEKVKHMCTPLFCPTTTKFDRSPWTGVLRENGESWCIYEGMTGKGLDLVGSEQYRATCFNGKETIELVGDARNKICIAGKMQVGSKLIDSAGPRENQYKQCVKANLVDTTSCDVEWADMDLNCKAECEFAENREECCKKQVCREQACKTANDCLWLDETDVGNPIETGDNAGFKACVPAVPPGGKAGSEGILEASQCDSIGDMEFTSVWVKEGYLYDWDCKYNCKLNTKEFANAWNTICASQGDCGAYYNVEGKLTKDGFDHTGPDWGTRGEDGRQNSRLKIYRVTDLVPAWTSVNKATGQLNGSALFDAYSQIIIRDMQDNNDGIGWVSPGIGSATVLGYVGIAGILAAATSQISLGAMSAGILGSVGTSATTLVGGTGATTTGFLGISSVSGVQLGGLTSLLTTSSGNFLGFLAIQNTAAAGGSVATGGTAAAGSLGTISASTAATLSTAITVIGIGIAAYFLGKWILSWGSDTREVHYEIKCMPYKAPTGGSDCGKCMDKSKYPLCTAYKCASLGQQCKFNSGDGSDGTCYWDNPNDMNAPIISLLAVAPLERNNFIENREPSGAPGYSFNGLYKALTSIEVGVTTDKYAECKISRFNNKLFDEMKVFGNGRLSRNHTMVIPIAQVGIEDDEDRIELVTDPDATKLNQFFVTCKATNDKVNTIPYYIKINVEKGKDISAPIIREFSIKNNAKIPFNTSKLNVKVLLNEPAPALNGCKASVINQAYERMEINSTCLNTKFPGTSYYPCEFSFKNLKDEENTFYIRCMDRSPLNNTNQQSEVYKLIGTRQLQISNAGPSGNVENTTVELEATTTNGASDGKSNCFYSQTKAFDLNGIKFTNTNSNQHSTLTVLPNEKDYTMHIFCQDEAGNQANTSVKFHTTTPDMEILDVTPATDSKVYASSFNINAKVAGGVDRNGKSVCSYNQVGTNGALGTGSQLGQVIEQTSEYTVYNGSIEGLDDRDYTLNITCTDNYKKDSYQVKYTINSEAAAAMKAVLREGDLLTFITESEARCRYSDKDFVFKDGNLAMVTTNNIVHTATIAGNAYIRCEDTRTNREGKLYIINN